jgi:hypothetical protein
MPSHNSFSSTLSQYPPIVYPRSVAGIGQCLRLVSSCSHKPNTWRRIFLFSLSLDRSFFTLLVALVKRLRHGMRSKNLMKDDER